MKRLTALVALMCANAAMASSLVLYTNDFEDIIGERFTADTGYEIEVIQMSGGNLLARIAAEANNPRWDVLLFDGVGSLHAMDQQGLFLRNLNPDNARHLTEQGRALVPPTRAWMPAGTTASCVLTYRTDLVDNPPRSVADLSQPRFKGQIGQADPAVAAPAYPCVAWMHYNMGMNEARNLYAGILNNDLRVFRTNGPVRRALSAGEIHVAMLSSPNAYDMKASGEPVEIIWPEDGAPASSRGVAIQANSEHMSAAQAFVNWMISPATQQFLTDNAGADGMFLSPVQGVTPLPQGPGSDAQYNVAPAAWAAEHEADIKSWFADQAVN
ncbi:MAG: extracellular solute-binding protein [Natronospirillum sp.]